MIEKISKLSLIGTAYNDEGNIKEFCSKADEALRKLNVPYEIIIVDDGSRDGTYEILKSIKQHMPPLQVVQLQRNYGQSAAIAAGFEQATGDIIFLFDTDLQQDPADIAVLYSKILEGYDVVSGLRSERKHNSIILFMSSIVFVVGKSILGIPLRDAMCTPNAYRRYVIRDLNLYGNMHRFLVPLLYWRGYRVIETPIPHYYRNAGSSKYSVFKYIPAFFDLVIMKFWMKYSRRPILFFGGIGALIGVTGFLIGSYFLFFRIFNPEVVADSRLHLFSAVFILAGTQFVFFGIVADLVMRLYFKDRSVYFVRNI